MKPTLQFIPTEVWVDVFRYPGKSRKELCEIADQIGNRKFAEFLQFYLHEWGKRTLGHLHFKKDSICKSIRCAPYTENMDFVQTPMPDNIKFFERIAIWHFDSSTLHFLRQINTLFNGVNLYFGPNCCANLRTIFGRLSPLIHGIHSLSFKQNAISLVEQYFGQKLAQVKRLTLDHQYDPAPIQKAINFCLNWLISGERDSIEPRFLKVYLRGAGNLQQFCMAVRQQFLSANAPCTFAIGFNCYTYDNNPMTFHLENNLGEQLDGQFDGYGDFFVYRHKQVDFARTQLEEWAKKTAESHRSSGIDFGGFVTIGQIDANDANDEVNERVDEEEADKPSTSG